MLLWVHQAGNGEPKMSLIKVKGQWWSEWKILRCWETKTSLLSYASSPTARKHPLPAESPSICKVCRIQQTKSFTTYHRVYRDFQCSREFLRDLQDFLLLLLFLFFPSAVVSSCSLLILKQPSALFCRLLLHSVCPWSSQTLKAWPLSQRTFISRAIFSGYLHARKWKPNDSARGVYEYFFRMPLIRKSLYCIGDTVRKDCIHIETSGLLIAPGVILLKVSNHSIAEPRSRQGLHPSGSYCNSHKQAFLLGWFRGYRNWCWPSLFPPLPLHLPSFASRDFLGERRHKK